MSYLLGITIGPVQAIIEESKKLKDLRNSSLLISNISYSIFSKLKNKNVEIIYPKVNDRKNVNKEASFSNFSNYIILQVNEELSKEKVIKAIDKTFTELSELNKGINVKLLKDKINVFWLYEKLQSDEDDEYERVYRNVTSNMADLKNTYEFNIDKDLQNSVNNKCIVCGERNIFHDEELCEFCKFKREYNNKIYKSVDNIAVKNWSENYKEKIEQVAKEKKLDNIINVIEDHPKYFNYNEILTINKCLNVIPYNVKTIGDLKNLNNRKFKVIYKKLHSIIDDFKEVINKKETLDNIEISNLKDTFKKIEEYLDALYNGNNLEKENSKSVKNPRFIYSFIKYDIDNLGKWMNGKYLYNESLKDFQSALSTALCEMEYELENRIEKKCEIIYSGGDDFLAILPVDNIYLIMNEIDNIFKDKIVKCVEEYTLSNDITYSVSITIAQCKNPMSYTLARNRLDLEEVKEKFESEGSNKNGLAIRYIINNNSEIYSYLKRDLIDDFFNLVIKYNNIKSKFSFSFIEKWSRNLIKLNEKDINLEDVRKLNTILEIELKRLMNRSASNKEDEEVVEYIKEYCDFIKVLIKDNLRECKINNYNFDIHNIISSMKLIERFTSLLEDIDYRERR